MTSVQKLSIPVVLGGRDVLIQSQTGSGKLKCTVLCFVFLLTLISVDFSVFCSTEAMLVRVKYGGFSLLFSVILLLNVQVLCMLLCQWYTYNLVAFA